MDFPGGSITNIRVIDGFSNIYWRIYTEEPNITNLPGEAPANGYTILKHLSRLKDLELRLRNLDCLVSSYPRRLGLWVFSATPDFEGLGPLCSNQGKDEQSRLLVGTSTLKVSASGNISSCDIVKNLSGDPQNTSGNPAGPQRPQNAAGTPTRRVDGYSSSATIYASFISAVAGALNLQLIRRNKAIPLGSRSLFTVLDRECDEPPMAADNDPCSFSALTTLQVQLTSAGKLTVTLQTISQPGILRLWQPGDNLASLQNVPPGVDLWLAPSGSVARLVTTTPDSTEALSSYLSGEGVAIDGIESTQRKQWKHTVLEWLKNFGLSVDSIEETIWVEVEVWEPFYSRLAGETLRPNEENTLSLPLKRILWPAIYCFRRVKSATPEPLQTDYPITEDPLDFAQKWNGTKIPENADANPKPAATNQERPRDQEAPLGSSSDLSEGFESLARASQYPDLQTASLVYPTPPDGAAGMGPNATAPSDGLVDDADMGLTFTQTHNKPKVQDQLSAKDRSDVDMAMGFGPSAGLMVGSGLYDTNDDDDLFGDMNEKDFGAKGITDADFSFFDDPGYDRMPGAPAQHAVEDMPGVIEPNESEIQHDPLDTITSDVSVPQKTPIENTSLPETSPLLEHTPKPTHQETSVNDNLPGPSSPDENNQTISPPLSPVEIKKILLPGSTGKIRTPPRHLQGQSYYNPIAFKQNMSNWDQKYGATGKFWFTASDGGTTRGPANSLGDIPTIGLPKRHRKVLATEGSSKTLDGQASPPSDYGQEPWQDSDSSIDSSDESDSAVSEWGASPATFSTRKRKRARSNSSSLPVPEKPPGEPDQESSIPQASQSIFIGNFLSTFSDWSMTGYFSFPENQVFPVLTRKDLQVQVAQILADQVTQSSLDHKLDGRVGICDIRDGAYSIRTFLEDTEFLDGMERLDLNGLISLQDNDLSLPANNATSRQGLQRKETGKGSISKLSPPHVRIRRGKEYLETLPPAVSFWETFGLEPASGPKDIAAYCICPESTTEAADAFLERIGLLYSSCNLGEHARGDKSNGSEQSPGLWNMESSDYRSAMQSLKVICEALGVALRKVPPSKDNIVIYMINPFTHAAAMVDLCSAFWSLFQKYAADLESQQARLLNEVVLQIIPMDFVVSAESLVVPPQVEYLSLALEVYSRCPPQSTQPSLVNCAPPLLLAEPLPRSLNFRLASEKSSPLQEGKCLHVAWSRSQDQRWISVAWSDNTGSLQRTMSYNLRFRGGHASRNVQDIRAEIWAATKEIMDRISARWRLMIVYTGLVDQDEIDAWSNFVEQYNKTGTIPAELTVLNVTTAPDLYLEPPFLPIPMSVFSAQTTSTPVATPNPSVLSPDQAANAPTPPSGANAPTPTESTLEAESESLLTDICDESWGVILSHRLNSSPHLTEYRPALTSGYLLRRKGATDGDGLYTLTVNLMYTQRHPSAYESLLRETLGTYRDLATLAHARGTCAVKHSTMPWHIATAIRAQELLSYVL